MLTKLGGGGGVRNRIDPNFGSIVAPPPPPLIVPLPPDFCNPNLQIMFYYIARCYKKNIAPKSLGAGRKSYSLQLTHLFDLLPSIYPVFYMIAIILGSFPFVPPPPPEERYAPSVIEHVPLLRIKSLCRNIALAVCGNNMHGGGGAWELQTKRSQN